MRGKPVWRRRLFAIAAVALTLAVVAPEIAAPAGAAPARAELAGKRRRRPVSPAARKAKILAAMRAKAKAQTTPTTTKRRRTVATPPKKKQQTTAAKRLAAKKAAQKRRAAQAALARRRAATNKKKSSLSIPMLALLAVAPFVLIGLYLLGADYLRRRVPRRRSGGTGGASLAITRVRDR
jgi:hypothetical protein